MQLILSSIDVQKNSRLALMLAIGLHILLLLMLLVHFSSSRPPVLQNQANAPIAASLVTSINHIPAPPVPAILTKPAVTQPVPPVPVKSVPPQPTMKSAELPPTVPKPEVAKPAIAKLEPAKPIPLKNTVPKVDKLAKDLLQQELAAEQKQLQKARADAKTAAQKRQNLLAQQELEKQLNQEQQQLSASQAAATQGEIDKYKVQILQAISQQWIVPQNLRDNLSCKLLIRLAPKGMVLNVTLIESSGDPILDRSAIAAVYKASPLPVPENDALFDNFRELNLTVKPNSDN